MSKLLGMVCTLAQDHPDRAPALHEAALLARKHNAPAYVRPCAHGWEATLDPTVPVWCQRSLVWIVGQFGAVLTA